MTRVAAVGRLGAIFSGLALAGFFVGILGWSHSYPAAFGAFAGLFVLTEYRTLKAALAAKGE